jgi:hypothetical protein
VEGNVRLLSGLLAAALAATLSACSTDVTWRSRDAGVGCTLPPVIGTLIDVNGRPAIFEPVFFGPLSEKVLLLRWPLGWQVRRGLLGLEVLDETGTVVARSGELIAASVATGVPGRPGVPHIVEGTLRVCGLDPIQEG